MRTIELYFDLASPSAYLAFTQLPSLASERGVELVYKPILLGGVFQASGNASPAAVPAKGAYIMRDLARYAALYGVPLRFNPHFPMNTLSVMRIAAGLQRRAPQHFLPFVSSLFHAAWVDGLNISDLGVVGELISRIDADVSAIIALSSDAEIKAVLKHETEQAVKRGVFGVPAMFVGGEMFWGQDRLDFVRAALSRGDT